MYRCKFISLHLAAFFIFLTSPIYSATNQNVLNGEWPIVGQDYGNHGNAISSINSSNAASLFQPSNFKFFFPTTGLTSGHPAISNGVAYFGDYAGYIYAINIDTGAQIWKTPNLGNEFGTTPVITNDYIYIAGGNLFQSSSDPVIRIFCLKRSDGSIVWSQPVAPTSGTSPAVADYTGDVSVVDNLAIVGVSNTENVYAASGDYKSRGSVAAFNRLTGQEVWRFYTTSDQMEPNPEFGGGVGVWSSAGIDLDRKLLFIGTGQNFETPVSPYQDSLLAIDYKTGKLKWFKQMSVNDVWSPVTTPSGPDNDVNTHVNLFTVDIPGKGKKDLVGVGDKAGRYYILEREQPSGNKSIEKSPKILVTLYLDQASVSGTIQATPTVDDVNDIIYVASDAIPGADPNVRVSMNAADIYCTPAEGFFCNQPYVVPKIAAYDLKKLAQGMSQADSLIWEYKSSTDPHNRGESFGPLAKANDVIFYTNGYGAVRMLNAAEMVHSLVILYL